MSQQGPIIVVSTAARRPLRRRSDVIRLFPVVEAGWADGPAPLSNMCTAGSCAGGRPPTSNEASLAPLAAARVALTQPIMPLIAVDPTITASRQRDSVLQSFRATPTAGGAAARDAEYRSLHATRDAAGWVAATRWRCRYRHRA